MQPIAQDILDHRYDNLRDWVGRPIDARAIQIYQLRQDGVTQRECADRFGVCVQRISQIESHQRRRVREALYRYNLLRPSDPPASGDWCDR